MSYNEQASAQADMHEKCGVFGIYAPGRDVARLTFFSLYALQHRGQEGAGIATSDGSATYAHKGSGLVAQVFNEQKIQELPGHLAIGHTRYSTTGVNHVRNLQPYLIETISGPLGVAHNGNLTNTLELRQQLLERGVGLSSTTDTEVIVQILAAAPTHLLDVPTLAALPSHADTWITHIRALMHIAEGAYTLVILTRDALYAVRDPFGLRPLCLGKLDEGYVLASESCALLTIGADYIREIAPGEIIRIDHNGILSLRGAPPQRRALCSFEYVYFARPDSLLEEQSVHDVRQRLGRQLAHEAPAVADVVVGVPDSATPAAIGYSLESGIPYTEGLTKNRYIGRTFIQPDDDLRRNSVRLKYNALAANLHDKRVILVDDSIVRGNTVRPLVQLLRDAGATEVHVRVSSPPVRNPCFMGVDMATRRQLIAHHYNTAEICERVGADSLAYLSLAGMLHVIGAGAPDQHREHCTACFSNQYPFPIPAWLFDEDREKLMVGTMIWEA